jgi:hypothetical protein
MVKPFSAAHDGWVDSEPEPRESRREEIRRRLGGIHLRIDALQAKRQHNANPAGHTEQLASAQRDAAASRAAANLAVTASIRAFGRAAEAHDRAARQHDRNAAATPGDTGQHEQKAASHRAAAEADRQRAEDARSLSRDEQVSRTRGPGTNQALNRLVSRADRHTASGAVNDAGSVSMPH